MTRQRAGRVTPAQWADIWEKFEAWISEQNNPDWWDEQRPEIMRLVNAASRKK